VIEASRAALKERGDNDSACFASHLANRRGARSGNSFGKVEQTCILALAKVLRAKKLGQANDIGSQP
jgi:hypothetical protein